MKRSTSFSLLFLYSSLTCNLMSQTTPGHPGFVDQGCHSSVSSYTPLLHDHSRNYASTETDVYYQDMHVEINPAVNAVQGVITYHFTSKLDQLNRLVLDDPDTILIHFVRRGTTDLSYTQADDLLTIDLGKNLLLGEKDALTISYEAEGILRQGVHNGSPEVNTDAALDQLWYPGKKDLVDKIDSLDLYVTTPLGQLAAGNGKLISIREENGKLIHHWQHRHPIATTYLLQLSVTNYIAIEDSVLLQDGSMLPLLHYLYPESVAAVLPEIEATPEIMQFFEAHFGPYPFAGEKYGHAQYSAGGALEVQTMSFMGFFDFGVIAHEMAHQWFGDFVTCGSWSDIWLNEGMAEYLEGLAIEALRPNDWNGLKTAKINSITSQPGGSVFVEDTTDLNQIFDGRLTYNKGFYLAHMLRWLTGDSLFFRACYNYLHDPDHADAFARTIDFQNHFESVSGLDLDNYFADWFYGEGYPSYTIDWTQAQDSIILWVRQTQSHPSVSYFEMPIHVQAYRFGVIAEAVFPHAYDNQRFSFYVGNTMISQLLFDPEKWILSRNNKINHIITAVHETDLAHLVRLHPNPASSYLEMETEDGSEFIQLTDLQGIPHPLRFDHRHADIQHLGPGYYIATFGNRASGTRHTQPIVILR